MQVVRERKWSWAIVPGLWPEQLERCTVLNQMKLLYWTVLHFYNGNFIYFNLIVVIY